jgi:hypothetical protein
VFPSSGEGRETTAVLDPLQRANLSHWVYITNANLSMALREIIVVYSGNHMKVRYENPYRLNAEYDIAKAAGVHRDCFITKGRVSPRNNMALVTIGSEKR